MSALKIVVALLGIALAAVSIKILTKEDPLPPPNERVNEYNFDRLRSGMTQTQVEAILGLPDKTTRGEIVQLERLGAADLQGTIQEQPDPSDGSRLIVYRGRDDETIEVLFSSKEATVLAAEYDVSDYPVMYRGPRVAKRSQDLAAVSARRSVGTSEIQKQKETVARYNRRKTLEKRSGSAFYSKETPDQPATASADAAPASTSASIASNSAAKSAPLQQPVAQQPSEVIQTGSAAASPETPKQAAPSEINPMPTAKQIPAIRVKPKAPPTGPMEIKLPSGKILSESVPKFDLPQPWPGRIFPPNPTVFVANHPNNTIRGVFVLKKPKFHGPAVTLHDNGRIEAVAFYADGKLHGPVRMWTDQKERLLYAEYKNGNKHGLTCLYSDKLPWLVQEWDSASLQKEYLVQSVEGLPVLLSASDLGGAEAEEYARAKEQLDSIEQKMHNNEIAFKRNLVDWYRKEVKKAKPPVAKTAKKQPMPPNNHLQPANTFMLQPNEMQWRNALIRAAN
jgi:antitoxin component YwqK of YwqJK toxin-antitoxin module